ncbi:MAG: XRE family transcriptional regulator [Cycloclasticus sp.]
MFMTKDLDFGPTIKRLRLQSGMTLEELSAATDYVLQNGYISQLERKPIAISFNKLNSLCKALGISVADMIREVEGGEKVEFSGNHIPIRDENGERSGKMLAVPHDISGHCFALKINTQSMESTTGISYFKGGYAIIKPCDSLESGGDYVLRIDEKLFISRYESDGRRHLLTYLNPKYPLEHLPKDPDIKGRVIGFFYFSL